MRRLQTRLDERLTGIGLSYAQYEVMEHLAGRPNLHAGELRQVSPETRFVFLDAIAALDARMAPAPKASWWSG